MKIAFSPAAGVPTRSAESIFVMKMCEAFATAGHDVTLLNPRTPDRDTTVADVYGHYGVEPSFSIEPVLFPRGPLKRAICALASVIRARRLGVDLLYTRSLYSCFLGVSFGLRTVFEIHSPVGAPGRLDSRLLRGIVGHANLARIVVITARLQQYLEHNNSIPTGRVIVVPDAAEIPATDERIERKDPQRLQVGYIGHLYPGRGIELIAELALRRPEMDFHCVGGLESDVEYWTEKMREVENFHLHGYVPFAATAKFRLSFDVLTAPYMRKVGIYGDAGADTSLASDLPAIREVLTHERDSVLCNPDDIDAWEAALVRLQQDVFFRNRIAECAYEAFLSDYTWETRAGKILASLDSSSPESAMNDSRSRRIA
jgi:glycosyltransferase involved in cell wall biosynthesis